MPHIEQNIVENPRDRSSSLHIDFPEGTIVYSLYIMAFEDNGYYVNYCPALKVSSYGKSSAESRHMMTSIVLPDLFEQLIELGKPAAFEFLSKMDWVAIDRESKDFENSVYVDKNGILQNFNLPEDTEIQEEILTFA